MNPTFIHAPLPWQQPNATEYTAARAIASVVDPVLSKSYIAFPWATWIDRCRHGCALEPPPSSPDASGIRATVCQHIWALEHLELFQQAGITDLFWSHAIQSLPQIGGMRVHPFPLYPVRCATHPPTHPLVQPMQRPLLYSFQGAYEPGLYSTSVRDWILNMPPRSDAVLAQRGEWHFEQAVYREQVLGLPDDPKRNTQLNQDAGDYSVTLQNSCFALCPSGSGPNTIRLWEALGYGAIPVILSDQLELPGPERLWREAALMVRETQSAVLNLPRQLEFLKSDPDRLLAMQAAGQLLWLRYGIDSLATDLIHFLRDPMTILRTRALMQLPTDKPLIVEPNHPADLPIMLRRGFKKHPQTGAVLVMINDVGRHQLLELRWHAALRLCKDLLNDRPGAVVSMAPRLEEAFRDG